MKPVPNAVLAGSLLLTVVGLLLILAGECMRRRYGSGDRPVRPEAILGLWQFAYIALMLGAGLFVLWLWSSRALEPPTSKDDGPFGSVAMLVLGAVLAFLPGRASRQVEDLRERAKSPARWSVSTARLPSLGWLLMLAGLVYLGLWLAKSL